MTTEKLPPMHPGEVLREEFLEPLDVSAYAVAKAVGLTPQHVAAIARENRNITTDSALRLGRYFFVDAEAGALFWLNLQRAFDMATAKAELEDALEGIVPRHEALEQHRQALEEMARRAESPENMGPGKPNVSTLNYGRG